MKATLCPVVAAVGVAVAAEVMTGGAFVAFTVSVAAALVALPTEFVTTQRNVEPLSAVVVAGVVYDVPVADAIFAPLFCH